MAVTLTAEKRKPQARRCRASNEPPIPPTTAHYDIDIDLSTLAEWDAINAITPGLLTKHYFLKILMATVPLSFRHIIYSLTNTVPIFAIYSPANARIVVV